MVKPSYYVCGAGSEVNCNYWDDINGCWRNCKNFGEIDCEEEEDD